MRTLLLIITVLCFTLAGVSQPPSPSQSGKSSRNIPGGGAPIGGGVFILLGLAAVYGVRKYIVVKEELED